MAQSPVMPSIGMTPKRGHELQRFALTKTVLRIDLPCSALATHSSPAVVRLNRLGFSEEQVPTKKCSTP